jgi:drug/metabolite transporter (DMT)-like permease
LPTTARIRSDGTIMRPCLLTAARLAVFLLRFDFEDDTLVGRLPMIPAVFTAILFAVSAVCAGRSTRLLGAGPANLSRLVLATGLLALWAHIWGQGVSGAGLPWLLLSGLIGFGFGDLALYGAYRRIGPRLGVLLCLCLAAPVGALTEWLWLGTRLTLYQIAWGTTILVGVLIALAPDSRAASAGGTPIVGIVLGALAAFGQAGGAVLTRKAFDVLRLAGQHIDGGTAAYQRILGGVLLCAAVVLIPRWRKSSGASAETIATDHPWKRAWPWVIANALSGPALGVACYQWALAIAPTGIVLAITATTPLVVIPFTMVLDGERPALRSLAGGAVAVLGAVALVYR